MDETTTEWGLHLLERALADRNPPSVPASLLSQLADDVEFTTEQGEGASP
jgi:hypothetical protein